jgi:cell pole-organizing protein PopZ
MSDKNAEQEPSMEEILASIKQIISEDVEENPSVSDEKEKEDIIGPENDVLVLTDEIRDDGTVVNLSTLEGGHGEESEAGSHLQQISAGEISESRRAADNVVVGQESERLVSADPAMTAISSLAELAAAVNTQRRATDPSIGPRTIEDLVKEVMRPMIREWLDDNLPPLVDRVVGREIERLTRDAEDISQR